MPVVMGIMYRNFLRELHLFFHYAGITLTSKMLKTQFLIGPSFKYLRCACTDP